MRVYIAGPMSGHKDWGWHAFARAARVLRKKGYIVISPAEVDQAVWGFDGRKEKKLVSGMNYRSVLSIDLGRLLPICEAIYLLKGWSQSKGARAERAAAEAYQMQIMYAPDAERGEVSFVPEEVAAHG